MLVFYERFQEKYGWRVSDIDEMSMALLLDQLCAVSRLDGGEKQVSIEDVT